MKPQIISPFDPAARERLRRMKLIAEDNQINEDMLEAVGVVQAGLFFSQILDACGDWESTLMVCRRMAAQAALISERQVLLLISIQYDTIAKPLPEVIWWISGSEDLLSPFVRCFVRHLIELCTNGERLERGDSM